MKALWNNVVIAESDKTVVIETNHYFPPESVKMEFFNPSGEHYQCSWKGLADYYDVTVDGKTSHNGGWVYPNPTKEAENIKEYFAFWMGIEVNE